MIVAGQHGLYHIYFPAIVNSATDASKSNIDEALTSIKRQYDEIIEYERKLNQVQQIDIYA